MKRFLIIGLIVGLVLVVVGGAGVVFARVQEANNPTTVTVTTGQGGDITVQPFENGPSVHQNGNGIFVGPDGMMGRNDNGYGPGGMMGGHGRGGMMGGNGCSGILGGRGMGQNAGVMQKYMISAFASAVGLTIDDVNTRLANGETLAKIAIAQGKTEADLPALWTQVRQDALNKAVANGVITQAQADAMLKRMNNYSGPGFGPGFGGCPMLDGNKTKP